MASLGSPSPKSVLSEGCADPQGQKIFSRSARARLARWTRLAKGGEAMEPCCMILRTPTALAQLLIKRNHKLKPRSQARSTSLVAYINISGDPADNAPIFLDRASRWPPARRHTAQSLPADTEQALRRLGNKKLRAGRAKRGAKPRCGWPRRSMSETRDFRNVCSGEWPRAIRQKCGAPLFPLRKRATSKPPGPTWRHGGLGPRRRMREPKDPE